MPHIHPHQDVLTAHVCHTCTRTWIFTIPTCATRATTLGFPSPWVRCRIATTAMSHTLDVHYMRHVTHPCHVAVGCLVAAASHTLDVHQMRQLQLQRRSISGDELVVSSCFDGEETSHTLDFVRKEACPHTRMGWLRLEGSLEL